MSGILLDTNVVIDYLRRKKDAVNYLHRLLSIPHFSAVTVMELYSGVRVGRETRQLEVIIGHSNVLNIDAETGAIAGKFMKEYRSICGLDAADALIAATAKQQGLELATLNLKHFPMFENLKRPY